VSKPEDDISPEWLCRIGRWSAPLLLLVILWCPAPPGLPIAAWRLVAVTAAMALLWFTQAIPIAATSLIPLGLYPLLGILSSDKTSKAYIDSNVWLAVGGFIIALGIQKWGLHRRLSLHLMSWIGGSPRRIVLGFMLVTGFISMWISNTATTLMMLPIALALLKTLEELPTEPGSTRTLADDRTLPLALMLGIAYAASIGGVTTPIGTPTNVAFLGIWKQRFPEAPVIPAGEWILVFGPCGLLMLLGCWFVLTRHLPRTTSGQQLSSVFFRERLSALGPITRPEVMMLVIFCTTALLWVFRTKYQLGDRPLIYGWADGWEFLSNRWGWLPGVKSADIHDATVSITMVLLMFCLPVGNVVSDNEPAGRTQFLMDWETAVRLPWDVVVLFGGGFAMAAAFESTGLSAWVGDLFAELAFTRSPWFWVPLIAVSMAFLSELTSNVATVNMFLPILASLCLSLNLDPRLLMLPATIATSLSFMLPVGTPPNAIAFATGRIRVDEMARYGFVLNLLGAAVVTLITFGWMVPWLGIDLAAEQLPAWAVASPPKP